MGGLIESTGEDVLLARVYLSRVAEPACVPVWEFVREQGPVAAATAIAAGRVPDRVAEATAARRRTADPHADLASAERHGIRLLVPESADWPHFAFAALEATGLARLATYRTSAREESGELVPPLALWVKGDHELTDAAVRSVAIVGARSSSGYGDFVTKELAHGLAVRGVLVVSGGAYGIDAAAHRSALAADEPTLLVSAGGLDRPYPPGHAGLFEQVAGQGLLISESPPGAAPQRHRFLTRNRLIASLATGTVVVEAARRSGAINTARHARRLGRLVMAVPGPVTSIVSVGTHNLLRSPVEPALLVTSVNDVLAAVGSSGEGLTTADPAGSCWSAEQAAEPDLRDRLDQLEPTARLVFDGLPARRPAGEEEVAARSGLTPLEVIRAIPVLQLAGLVESSEDGYRIAASARPLGRPARRPG